MEEALRELQQARQKLQSVTSEFNPTPSSTYTARREVATLLENWPFFMRYELAGDPFPEQFILRARHAVAQSLQLAIREAIADFMGIDPDIIDIKVEIYEGSIIAKIKNGFLTITVILGFYVTVHEAIPLIVEDWRWINERIKETIEVETGLRVRSVEENYTDVQEWTKLFTELNAIRRQHFDPPPEDDDENIEST